MVQILKFVMPTLIPVKVETFKDFQAQKNQVHNFPTNLNPQLQC